MNPPTSDRIGAYARAIHGIVEAEGRVAEASDDLFRFARAVEANDELRSALVDAALPLEQRLGVVEELLAPALTVTRAAVTLIVAAGRAADLPAIVDRLTGLVAEAREQAVAEVRSAVPLDDAVVERLAAALSAATGKSVQVRVIVDERVLGGVVARIGDTVIDGSVRHRLEQLQEEIRQ